VARALSKLALASRAEAIALVLAGRVRIDGRIVRDPGALVRPERITVSIDGAAAEPPPRRTIALHKPRGVVTTRRDPRGRPTVQALLDRAGAGLTPVGRLDMASTGLLLGTTDTQFAAWLLDPASQVEREYAVTVRGRVDAAMLANITAGLVLDGERLVAKTARLRKASTRESHLVVTLTEGRNREIRRLLAALGHEVTRLHRVRIGGIGLGDLAPGCWRIIPEEMLRRAFPEYSGRRSGPDARTARAGRSGGSRPPDPMPAARRSRS
jgi:23S rRNA pseudouridine2605 synthase